MTRGNPAARELALAVTLAALAGAVDATGFVQWHGLFVSFMSGNTTQAAAAVLTDAAMAGRSALAIAVYVAGVVLGEVLRRRDGRGRALVLGSEALLLAAGSAASHVGSSEPVVASLLGLAMGVQNASIHTAQGVSVSLTFVTGTLVNLGRRIAAALRGDAGLREAVPFAALWCGLFVGAALGAVGARVSEAGTIGCLAALCAGLAALVRHSDRSAAPADGV